MDKNIIKFNIFISIALTVIVVLTLFYYIRKIYNLNKHLKYYYESEIACNKDPIEMETVRYNMDIILTNDNNIKNTIYGVTITTIVVSSLMLIACVLFKLYDFILIYVALITLSSLLLNSYKSNDYSKNEEIDNYRKLKENFIIDLQQYLNKNNIITITDLPPQLLKSLITRYKVIYDINNSSDEYLPILNNEYEIIQKIKIDLEKTNDKNEKYIDTNELFKYLKLYYDTSNPKYSSDIEYLTKQQLNKDIFEIINEYFWDNETLLNIMSKKYISVEAKIASLKPYLKEQYKNAINIFVNDKNERVAKSVKGKEKDYENIVTLIIKNDILLNKNIENIMLSKYLYTNEVKTILEKQNYNNIADKLKDLRKYLKQQYQDAIDEKTGEATEFKNNTYSYIKLVVSSNDKLLGKNDMSSFYNLAYGKRNPYESLNSSFNKIILQLWIYIVIILYFGFHLIYNNTDSNLFIYSICITILIGLMLIMILPITWTV